MKCIETNLKLLNESSSSSVASAFSGGWGGIEKSLQTKWSVTHVEWQQWTPINWTTCCGLQNLQIFPGQFNRQFGPQILNLYLKKLSRTPTSQGNAEVAFVRARSCGESIKQCTRTSRKNKASHHPTTHPNEFGQQGVC